MRSQRRAIEPALALAALLLVGLHGGAATAREGSCSLRDTDAGWLQHALDGWDEIRREVLGLDPAPLPWIVLFDEACVWHIAAEPPTLPGTSPVPSALTSDGRPLHVRSAPHSGAILLPNRTEIPITVKASTMLYRGGRAPFLVLALPSVWRADADHGRIPHLEEFLLGIVSHEMTHTRQLVPINRRLRELIRTSGIAGQLNDDVIQLRFAREPGFQSAVERERDLFYKAAAEPDPARRDSTLRRALSAARERRARYFAGARSVYREIESLFLVLEGAGQWSAYKAAAARRLSVADALRLVRHNRRYWSQDEGLALFLLLDTQVPQWQSRIFGSVPACPFDLLEASLRPPTVVAGQGGTPRQHE